MTDLERLGLAEGATEEEVRARWQRLAPGIHPDRGGDAGAFEAALAAYRRALAAAAAPRECPRCGGSGTVAERGAFHLVRLACPACGGAGATDGQDRPPGGGGVAGPAGGRVGSGGEEES